MDFLSQAKNILNNTKSTRESNGKSAYQQNVQQPVQQPQKDYTLRGLLGVATNAMSWNPKMANMLVDKIYYEMNDRNSKYYNPYNQPTNRAVSNLAALGFDTNNLNDNWWNQNQGWVSSNLLYNGTTNTPSSPGKKATADQKIAYELYQWHKSEETTRKAEQEWKALQDELSYWAKDTDRNYSDEQILEKIDWTKYKTLTSMDENKYMSPTELNRAIGYSEDAMYGVMWAARNPEYQGNIWGAMANSALGTGNQWFENPEITAKLNENDDNTYSPYSVGMTLEQEGLYFNTLYFDQEMIDEIKKNLDWNDKTAKEMINNVQNAEDFTVKAEGELANLNAKINDWLDNDKYTEKDIMDLVDKYMSKECKSLLEMDKQLRSRTPSSTTRAIDYKYDELKQRIHDRVAERDAQKNAVDAVCDEIDAITTVAPYIPSNGDIGADAQNAPNYLASGGYSDAGIKIPSQQERDVYKAQDAELKGSLAAVDGELTPAESTQMKNAGTVSWNPMKEIWQQVASLPAAMIGLAQRNGTAAAKLYVEGSMASMRFVNGYDNVKNRLETNQQMYDELSTQLGDISYLNKEVEQQKQFNVGDITFVMQYNEGDFANGVAPHYEITNFYAPGRGSGMTMDEIIEYGNDQAAIDEAEKLRKEANYEAQKILSAHNRLNALGEDAKTVLAQYQNLESKIQLDEAYLANNQTEYDQKKALLNSVNRSRDLVTSTNHMLGADTTMLEQAQVITNYLSQYYDEPPLYNESESMSQYYDRLVEESGGNAPYSRSEWNKMNLEAIDLQLGYLDMSEEWIKNNDVKLPDNVVKNMQYTRQDLENKRIAYEYASILSDTDPKEMEAAIAAGKAFEQKNEGQMHYWTELFNDKGDYYTLNYRDRYVLPDEGIKRDVVSEEDENLYYYLLGKKVLEMGDSLDDAIMKINTDPDITREAVREVFSDAKKFQQFMEDENTGYGLWSIREYEGSAGMGGEMVKNGQAIEANVMSTLVTPAESIANIYSALDYLISGKRFNPKSFTARFSAFKETTRAETRKAINNYFDGEDTLMAKLANLGYEIYCNRGDSLMNSMVFGSLFHTGVGMIDEFLGASPMGATAAMNAAYQAIENGASTEQAWLIAGATFLAETATEAVTLSNIKEAMGFEGELTGDSLKSIVTNWLTQSGVEEMIGESANDVIEDYAQQLAKELYKNPNYKTDHDNLVAKYVGEGMSIEDAEATASRDEIQGVLHTALVSYLSSGTEVIMGGTKAVYNSYMTAKSQTADTDQSAISKMYENWKNRDNDEASQKKEEAFAKQEEQREQAQEAAATEQQKGYATDVEILETVMGINDASARSAAMAATLVTENDKTGNDQANAAAVHVEDTFENGAQDVQEIMYGGMVGDVDAIALKRGIQYAALGGENSACNKLVQSDEFKAADPVQKAVMLSQAVVTDMWNTAVNQNVQSVVRENRIAEKVKDLVANGALQGTKNATEAVTKAEAESRQAQEDLESKQAEAEAAQQALDAAVTENNENPSDENAKQVVSASVELGQRDESAQQYEQHKAKLDAALEKAEAACADVKQKELAGARQQAEQIVDQEDQQIAEEKARIAEQERLDEEVRKKAFEEQQLNNNISRMDADDFISQYYPDATDEEKKTIRNAFVQARFEMGYTAQGFLQRKSFANAIEQKFGFKIKVGDTTEGGKVARKNAQIDKNTGTITLDTHATLDDMFYAILPHEVTHGAEKSNTYSELADAVLQGLYGEDASYEGILKAMENGDMSSQIAQDILAKKRLYDSKVGGNHTYREMAQEVVADGVGKILSGDQEAMDRLVAQKPSVAKRILNSIKNFLRKAAGFEAPSLTQAQQIADLLEQKLKDAGFTGEQKTNTNGKNIRYSVATESAIVQDEDGTPLAQEFDDGTAVVSPENFQYSLSSFDEDEQERVRQALLKKFPKDDVDKYMKDALGVACMIALDKQRLDFEASDNQVFLKPNNDYYFTLDASTLCAKRLLYQGTFDYVQHALPDEVFTPEDLIDLVNIMNDMGYETPCGICYVESRRRWLDTYAQKFLDTLPEEGRPSIDDLTTSDGLEKLRHDDPDMYKKFVDAMNKKGTANPKVVQLRTEYRGDISKMTAGQIQKVKDIGGLRIQSFSDFETPHLLDMMQAVMDMSAAGLTSQAYTKVPNFAWVFGNTGIKINLSLIGKGTGLDENGNLVFDNREGMNFDEAMQIRNQYGKNVGTILVGINDDHIVAAMGDPRIDFIIPFHKSGWSAEELRKMPTLNNYNDYTDTQNERLIIGRKEDGSYETESFKKHKDRTKESFENFQPVGKNGYWEFDKSGEENARNYLKMCADAKRVPKFSQFLVDNGDGSFSLPEGTDKRSTSIREGYWKTLIDFKMYENDGYGRTNEDGTKTTVKGAAQTEVTPNINMEEAYRVLNEYKLGRQMPDQADGTKGRFIPMESNNDVPVATAAGDRYIELIKNRRAGVKPNAPGPDTLEADLPVNPKASAFGASQAPAILGNTENETQETGAAQQAAMAINAETGETERVVRNSLPEEEYKYSRPSDAPYLSAVNHGDMEEAQRMVDEKADEAGYTISGYHGTSQEFTTFDKSKAGENWEGDSRFGPGFYFAYDRDTALRWTDGVRVVNARLKMDNPLDLRQTAPADLAEVIRQKGEEDLKNYDPSFPISYEEYVDNIERSINRRIENPASFLASLKYDSEGKMTDNISELLKSLGYDGIISDDEMVVFDPEQIKSADPVEYDDEGNVIPLSERFNTEQQDIRYSLPSENILNDQIRYYLEDQNAPQQTITQQLNPAEETKQRQWGREGAQQSDELAEQAKQYVLSHNEYTPDTNAEQLDRAVEWIRGNRGGADPDGYYTSLQKVTSSSFNYRSADGQARMVAVMGMAVAKNDVAGQVQLAKLYNPQGTTIAQALQARKLWKLMTPEGRVQTLNNMLKVAQDDLNAKGTDVELKLSDWIYMAATAATQDGAMEAVQKAAAKEIAEQLPANWRDKMRSWRMLSMLGNPRTHIRNVVGNALFIPAVGLKNKIGAVGEIVYNKTHGTTERSKTLSLFLDKDIRNFAREDAIRMKDTLTGEAKYNENNAVQKEQKAFKGLLQAVIDFNSDMLEREDWTFLKGHYRRALGGWMQANGYTVEQLKNSPSLLEKGRAYAIEEAQKATYRDFNKLAATLNKVSRDGGVAGFLVDAALPFKKTPANILKRGIEYSPVGLMKSVTSDLYHLKQWKDAQNGKLNAIPEKALSPTQFVDRMSSGLSGSVVLGIGALLASAGIITCGLDDDDDEFEKAKGAQKYAIKILGTDVTFTIDWAAPMSMPLFVGASLYDQFTKEGDFDIEALVDAFGNITEPVFNLSMLDGVNSLFKTSQYDDTNTLTQIFAKIGSNYVTSYVPSALGAATRTFFDDTQRKAFVESGKGTGVLGTARYAIEQVENKIPGLSRTNIPIRDIWGNANTSSFFERLVENFISPGYFNEYKDDPIINEMARLYDLTGDSSLVPSDPNKSVTYNKQRYVLNAEQWDTYKERRGQTAQRLLGELINTADYKNASFEVQAEMIKNVWSYADKVGKSAIIPGYKMDDLGANPVLSITKDSKVDSYKDEMIKALNANDFETYATMIQALRDEKVTDKDIKKKIGDTYRDKYKEAYRNKQNTVMAEIEDILDNTGFDFDYYDWQLQEDKKNKNSGGGGGGGRPSAIPERPASDNDWDQYMDDLDNYWASYDFDRNDPTEQNYNGTIDLNDRQVVHNEDGSISTEYSFSFWDDDIGKEVLIPRVVNGRIVSEQEAKRHYYETGEHLGMFDDWHDADEYAMMLHNRNNWYYNR